jgi:hypothetical protein
MGIAVGLFDAAVKVPHEDVHYLSRHEIAAYGIDRREFVETPWLVPPLPNLSLSLRKWIVEARGPDRKDYRTSIVSFSCTQAQRATVWYLRGLASDEVGRPVTATFSFGQHRTRLSLRGDGTRQDAVDTGAVFFSGAAYVPFDALDAAVAQGSIRLLETDPRADTKLFNVIELSTHGLAEGIKRLRDKCVQPAASWKDGAQIPFVPAQAGSPPPPVAPYGAYPVPERGLGVGGSKKK